MAYTDMASLAAAAKANALAVFYDYYFASARARSLTPIEESDVENFFNGMLSIYDYMQTANFSAGQKHFLLTYYKYAKDAIDMIDLLALTDVTVSVDLAVYKLFIDAVGLAIPTNEDLQTLIQLY